MDIKNISFKGINNIKIGKKEYSQIGMYLKPDNSTAYGEKYYTELRITANLTDDKAGNHLSDYLKRAPGKYVNAQAPDKIELNIKSYEVPEEGVRQSFLVLNNKEIIINDDRKLPLLTFLARFTREGAQNKELSENQKKYLRFANKTIHNEAINYIEVR